MRFRTAFLVLICAFTVAAQSPKTTAPAKSSASSKELTPDEAKKTEAFLREYYAWGKDFQISFGALKDSIVPNFSEVPVHLTFQGHTQTGIIYLSKDGKFLVQGNITEIQPDPFSDNRNAMSAESSPFLGPATASVVVFEFSDFECPHCMAFAQALKQIAPHYPQVRFVYKNFPITEVHPWAMQAAIAARCAFKTSNDAFWKMSDSIFANQSKITPADAATSLKQYAVAAGVPGASYDSCILDPGTKSAVEKDIAEGKAASVDSTPTVFVNGRPLVGGIPQLLEQYINYELDKNAPSLSK